MTSKGVHFSARSRQLEKKSIKGMNLSGGREGGKPTSRGEKGLEVQAPERERPGVPSTIQFKKKGQRHRGPKGRGEEGPFSALGGRG